MPKSWSKSEAPAAMKAQADNKPTSGDWRLVKFPRGVVVWRCENRNLKATNRRQCRKKSGGMKTVRARGRNYKVPLKGQFTRCPR